MTNETKVVVRQPDHLQNHKYYESAHVNLSDISPVCYICATYVMFYDSHKKVYVWNFHVFEAVLLYHCQTDLDFLPLAYVK